MGSILDKEAITKYKILPLLAIPLYNSLVLLISSWVILLASSLLLIVSLVIFEVSKVPTSSSSSKILPWASAIYLKILSSKSWSCLLDCEISKINWILFSSSSTLSCLTTSTNSWSSKPEGVTVKLIIVVLIEISGT